MGKVIPINRVAESLLQLRKLVGMRADLAALQAVRQAEPKSSR